MQSGHNASVNADESNLETNSAVIHQHLGTHASETNSRHVVLAILCNTDIVKCHHIYRTDDDGNFHYLAKKTVNFLSCGSHIQIVT